MPQSQNQAPSGWLHLSVTFPCDADDLEALIYLNLYAAGADAFHEEDDVQVATDALRPRPCKRLNTYFDLHLAAAISDLRAALIQHARELDTPIHAEISHYSDTSWQSNWRHWFQPAQISPRLAVRAPWAPYEAPPGVEVLVIEPGMAFGTGLHETTRLCLQAIDAISADHTIDAFLDVGCGSGVLAIAGARLGIPDVMGIDNDPDAVMVSRENATLNQAAGCTFAETPLADLTTTYPLVVANIISSVLCELCPHLVARVQPGGHLVLSGVLRDEAEKVDHHFTQRALLTPIDIKPMGEWVSLHYRRPAAT